MSDGVVRGAKASGRGAQRASDPGGGVLDRRPRDRYARAARARQGDRSAVDLLREHVPGPGPDRYLFSRTLGCRVAAGLG